MDFARVVTLPAQLDGYNELLRRKVLQLKDDARMRLNTKLAMNFGRVTDEERLAGLAPVKTEETNG